MKLYPLPFPFVLNLSKRNFFIYFLGVIPRPGLSERQGDVGEILERNLFSLGTMETKLHNV